MPPARLVPRVGDDPVVGDDDVVVLVVGVGRRQVRRADADGAVGAAVVLDHVVGDLQVAGVGVGEDRAALRDQAAGQAGGRAADGVDVAGEALLVAAAQVEAVDRRRRVGAVRRRERVVAVARQEQRDHRAVVDGLVAGPRQASADPGVPVGRHRAVAGEGAAVDDRAAHAMPSGLPGPTPCSLTALGDDQVLVVRAARVLARVGGWVVRVDDHQRAGRRRRRARAGSRGRRSAGVTRPERRSCPGRPRSTVGLYVGRRSPRRCRRRSCRSARRWTR